MSIQRKVTPDGKVRYRARIKANSREVASRMFDRKSDAAAWEQDQRRRLRAGEWLDPRRGQVPLNVVAEMWLESRRTVKRRTLESDRGAWQNYIAPRFGRRPVASITTADVSSWLGDLMRRGLARSTVTRGLATLRSLLSFAVADGRVTMNAAAAAKAPSGGQARREGRFLDLDEVVALAQACRRPYAELIYVLAMQGLRWGELAGLQVGDRVMVPGPGLRLSRAVLASNGGGELYVDTLKNKRARTVPLVPAVVPIVDRWSAGKSGVNGCSPRRRAVRCGKRTGSGRSAGVRRRRRLGGPSCAFTICATRRLRCGWRLALIRKWSSEYWGTPQLP